MRASNLPRSNLRGSATEGPSGLVFVDVVPVSYPAKAGAIIVADGRRYSSRTGDGARADVAPRGTCIVTAQSRCGVD